MASVSSLTTGRLIDSTVALNSEAEVNARIQRLTRRSFATGAIAALSGGLAWKWLVTRQSDDGIPWPLRRVLQGNERLAELLFDSSRLAPEFPMGSAVEPRVNGHVGLDVPANSAGWKVHVVGKAERHVPLAAIRALPACEMTTQLKCVEGWSSIVRWTGVRLSDFLSKFGSPSQYIGISTPADSADAAGRYYVGLDQQAALHSQTLLCYEMNGRPLTSAHGAPLRLVSTVKYGYKCIKRIGVIELTDQRPADYWAERGYDWYAGH